MAALPITILIFIDDSHTLRRFICTHKHTHSEEEFYGFLCEFNTENGKKDARKPIILCIIMEFNAHNESWMNIFECFECVWTTSSKQRRSNQLDANVNMEC